jgi:hypothetical protein
LIERPDHLMRFRFLLQPTMAAIAAVHDGVEDARLGRSPYIWTLLNSPSERVGRLAEGVISTARVLLFALCMDTVYQLIVLKTFYPAEASAVAIGLGFIPYLLLRGPIRRFVRWRRGGARADGGRQWIGRAQQYLSHPVESYARRRPSRQCRPSLNG